MRKSLLIAILVIAIVVLGFYFPSDLFFGLRNPAAIISSLIVDLTNKYRSANKVSLLTVNPLLAQAAKLKAEDMAQRGYFSHLTPEGRDFTYFLNQVGYNYKYAGENLAVNFFDSIAVTDAWIKSSSHRDNLVKDKYTEIGVASAEGLFQGRPSIFVVQYFGTPALDKK